MQKVEEGRLLIGNQPGYTASLCLETNKHKAKERLGEVREENARGRKRSEGEGRKWKWRGGEGRILETYAFMHSNFKASNVAKANQMNKTSLSSGTCV